MLHYVMRQNPTVDDRDPEPLALIRVNATKEGDMSIGLPRPSRFGPLAPVSRNGRHVYNLMIGNEERVEIALHGMSGWRLQQVTQAEWETWAEMELFPVLKLGMAA